MSNREERMVPESFAAKQKITGYEWEAALFFGIYEELLKIMSREEAKELLARGMYKAGHRLGQEDRKLTDRDDALGAAMVWKEVYGAEIPGERTVFVEPDRFVIKGFQKGVTTCPAMAVFERWGMSKEEIRFLADAYCAGDVGRAEGFSDRIHFQHTARVMVGDDHCEWDFSTSQQERSPSAVVKPNLED